VPEQTPCHRPVTGFDPRHSHEIMLDVDRWQKVNTSLSYIQVRYPPNARFGMDLNFQSQPVFKHDTVQLVISDPVADWFVHHIDRIFSDIVDRYDSILKDFTQTKDLIHASMVQYNTFNRDRHIVADYSKDTIFCIQYPQDMAGRVRSINTTVNEFGKQWRDQHPSTTVSTTLALREMVLQNGMIRIVRHVTKFVLTVDHQPTPIITFQDDTQLLHSLDSKPIQRKRKPISQMIKNKIMFDQDYRCNHCHKKLPPNHDFDHIIPIWKGGSNEITNLQCLCGPCHGNKTYYERLGNAERNLEVSETERMYATDQGMCENSKQMDTNVSRYFT
jgi:hypothetical protein